MCSTLHVQAEVGTYLLYSVNDEHKLALLCHFLCDFGAVYKCLDLLTYLLTV